MVRRVTEDTDDFQDIDIWKTLVVHTTQELKKKYEKNLIIPMTIYKEKNFKYIKENLEELDTDLYHFCLTGTYETIQFRLRKRGDKFGGWTYRRIETCLEAFSKEMFMKHICVDELDEEQVALEILKNINIGKR